MDALDTSKPPQLRDDVQLSPFDESGDSGAALIACDGRQFRVPLRLRQMVELIDGSRSYEEIAARLSELWNSPLSAQVAQQVIERELGGRGLLLDGDVNPAGARRKAASYIILSARVLSAPVVRFLAQRLAWLVSIPVACAILILVVLSRVALYGFELPQLAHAGGASQVPMFVVVFGCAMLTVLWHELGHAAACARGGAEPGEIRFGLYVVFPVFYADVSPAWRLPGRARLAVDLGGAYFQLMASLPFHLAYELTGLRALLVVVLAVDGMVLYTLNPFFRFDGYWALTDWLGVHNLSELRQRVCRRLLWRRLGHTIALRTGLPPHSWKMRLLQVYAFGSLLFWAFFFAGLFAFGVRALPQLPGAAARWWSSTHAASAAGNFDAVAQAVVLGVFQLLLTIGTLVIAWTFLRRVGRGAWSALSEYLLLRRRAWSALWTALATTLWQLPPSCALALLTTPLAVLFVGSWHSFWRALAAGAPLTLSALPYVPGAGPLLPDAARATLLAGPCATLVLALLLVFVLERSRPALWLRSILTLVATTAFLFAGWELFVGLLGGSGDLAAAATAAGWHSWTLAAFGGVALWVALAEIARQWTVTVLCARTASTPAVRALAAALGTAGPLVVLIVHGRPEGALAGALVTAVAIACLAVVSRFAVNARLEVRSDDVASDQPAARAPDRSRKPWTLLASSSLTPTSVRGEEVT